MNKQIKEKIDVVVVGAGPVGLLAAIELALAGVRVLVLERLTAPSLITKALGIGPIGIEALQRRGMGVHIAAAASATFAAVKKFAEQHGAGGAVQGPRFTGHFGGLTLIRAGAQKEPNRHGLPVDQQAIEAMLAERVSALGIEVRRDCEVKGFVQHEDGVEVEWSSPAAGGTIHCAWLVGCDGGRSAIRKMAGFDFPGTPPTMTMYNAVAEFDHPERLLPRGWRYTSGGIFAYGFLPGRLIMLDFSGPPEDRDAPVTQDEIESVLHRISGAEVRVKAVTSASRWTDNTRLVDTYRKDRVLLAGDAAHIHTPFGGQGISLGLADAANLGWKLAAIIHGEMPESLIDSYTTERRAVAEAVLANTLAQAAIMRPDPQSGAMRDLMANMLQQDSVNRYIGEMMSGLATRYDLGSEHDEVGRLIGDRLIRQGDAEVSLYEFMQDGRGVLLDASRNESASRLVAGATQRIRCITVDSGPSILIRPDACVAWLDAEQGTEGLELVLQRWFGGGPSH